ncbi:ATP-binding protein [Actinopolyspora mortivallis]|uniref:LuxR family transcriptional regulator n=1 Tax=Actinopolyspora mortivallis TaxID=33906 RepID=A0A2T0GX57_ACTMO|nr:LuxR family transcriptional regulator [Actinopolyspora mortivallis]PRW63691.1 LuxR family transcriptional regulator [Actinopolyspora mortivallis]
MSIRDTRSSHCPTPSNPPPPLVGRAEELHTLVEFATAPPAVVLLEGEAGVGKTRLVHETLRAPEIHHHNRTVGACRPPREPFPYGPVLDALRSLGPLNPPTPLNPVTGALRPLLPELDAWLPPAPERLGDPAAERHRVFRGIHALLQALGPVVLVVEDLHWSDEHTAELLRFLAHTPPTNLVLVLTYRGEELHGPPLGVAYRPPWNTRGTVLSLRPLTTEQVGALAAHVLGTDSVSPELARKLHTQTAGIPFVLEETLREVEGTAPPDALPRDRHPSEGHVEVPALLHDSLLERMALLPGDALRLVKAAAVLDEPADARTLGRMAEVTTAERELVHALRANVLYETPDGTYTFRHHLAHRTVYSGLTGPERTELHERALRQLADREPQPLARLALHSRASGRVRDWLRYGEAAADRASSEGDTGTAVELLTEMLSATTPSPRTLERLAVKYGHLAPEEPHRPGTTVVLEKLLASPVLSRSARGRVRLGHGKILLRTGSLHAARCELELAVRELHEHPEHAVEGMFALSHVHPSTTCAGEGRRWLERAGQSLAELHETPGVAGVPTEMPAALLYHGEPADEWIDLLDRTTRSTAEHHAAALAHARNAEVLLFLGQYHRCAEQLWKSRAHARNHPRRTFLDSVLDAVEIGLRWFTGRWEGLAEQASELLRDSPREHPPAAQASLVLGLLATARADWRRAEHFLGPARVQPPDGAVTPVMLTACAARARMWLSRQDLPEATRETDRALALVEDKEAWVWACDLLPVAVEAHTRVGDLRRARAVVERFRAATSARSSPLFSAAAAAAEAVIHEARDEIHPAVERWRTAHRRYGALPRPYSAALAAERLVRHSPEGLGTPTTGMVETVRVLERLGATGDAARCRHLWRARGSGTLPRRGRRGYGDRLSPREQEIVELAARGHTNREIAANLFLSPRTVEQHVARAIRKLGLRNRTELLRDDDART